MGCCSSKKLFLLIILNDRYYRLNYRMSRRLLVCKPTSLVFKRKNIRIRILTDNSFSIEIFSNGRLVHDTYDYNALTEDLVCEDSIGDVNYYIKVFRTN